MKPTLILALLLSFLQSDACLNYYGETLYGQRVTSEIGCACHFLHRREHYSSVHEKQLSKSALLEIQKDVKELRSMIAGNPANLKAKNDLAADLIKLGNYSDAKQLLMEILPSRPNDYPINANLGVLYELMGNTDSASYYTNKSFSILPNSHAGSEWLHIKILEISNSGNADELLAQNKLLNLDFGTGVAPDSTVFPYHKHIRAQRIDLQPDDSLLLLVSHIEYQLAERMSLVKSKNKIIGELLFALGDIYSLYFDKYWALWAYTKALEYGTAHDAIVKKRGAFLYPRTKKMKKPDFNQHSSTIKDYNKVMAFWAAVVNSQ
jgi:tetratricopeptide (TPR) repeat protein